MMLILDDHPLARQGIESIIQMIRPQEEILQAGNVKEAIECMKANAVDMVFVDVNLGKETGFDFVEWMNETGCTSKTFFITSSSRYSDFLHARKLGVDAFLLKDAFIDEIMHGFKVIERGGKFYSSALIDKMNQLSEEESVISELTQREIDVLVLLSQGYSNAKISETLYISEGTTKKHITSILAKLEMQSRVEAVLFASRNSFILKTALSRDVMRDMRRTTR